MAGFSFSAFVSTLLAKERPVGITLLAGFFLLYGLYRTLMALSLVGVLFVGGPGGVLVAPVLAFFYLAETAFLVGAGVVLVGIGAGLLDLNKWARIGVMAWIGLQVLLVLRIVGFTASRGLPVPTHGFRLLVGALIFAGVVAYLFRPEVRQSFGLTR
jgi:hypothetical protein